MIGVIAETAHGAVFQQQGHIGEQAARFLAGYHEAAGLVGMGVQMLPVVLVGQWPFPGTGELGEEKRCLVGLNDGSGNNSVYDSVLRCHPAISRNVDETVVSFISVELFQQFPMGEALNVGRLSACFDLAAWFVDALPGKASRGRYELTKWEVRALFLGVWVNILVTWLYGMDVLSRRTLHRMRLAICGIVMEKLALLKLGRKFQSGVKPLPVQRIVDVYMGMYPGMMGRISGMLSFCPEEYILQPSDHPEMLCWDVLDKSLNFFQSGQQA